MGLFKHDRDDAPQQSDQRYHSYDPEESGKICFCNSCGSEIRDSYRFCPYCGVKNSLFASLGMADAFSSPRANFLTFQDPEIRSETLDYLRQIGKLSKAGKHYRVSVSIPGQRDPVVLELPGVCRSDDALDLLRQLHYIDDDDRYQFDDWPHADLKIGSMAFHQSACVCELRNKVYRVRKRDERDLQVLYGCPNVHALTNHIPKKTVEVIDYD